MQEKVNKKEHLREIKNQDEKETVQKKSFNDKREESDAVKQLQKKADNRVIQRDVYSDDTKVKEELEKYAPVLMKAYIKAKEKACDAQKKELESEYRQVLDLPGEKHEQRKEKLLRFKELHDKFQKIGS